MTKEIGAASLDVQRNRRSAARKAKARAIGSGLLSTGSVALLAEGVAAGRFENTRYFGTIVFAEQPVGFVCVAAVWLFAILLFGWMSKVFWQQRHN